MSRVGLAVPPDRMVRGLSAAQKQLVQIAKALAADVKVLLLDEPTSSLTEHEARRLFAVLRELRARGAAIVLVTHKLDEIFAACHRVSVLRDGRFVGTRDIAATSRRELVELMLGRTAGDDRLGVLAPDWKTEVLRAENIVRYGLADDVSFSLHRGEVLGFYGLVGSGRTELARILIGEEPMDEGAVFLRGRRVEIRGVRESLYTHRLGYVTENRKEEGLLLDDSVQANLALAVWPRLRGAWSRCIDAGAEASLAQKFIASLRIKTPSAGEPVGHLSGGNQQKVSIGKWLAAECDILIVDEPTVGVDVGAKQQIHQLLWDLAARQGKTLIVISSDLPELVRLANRLLVFRDRRIVGEVRDIDTQRKTYAEVSAEIAPYFE
jgi:ribose transport system ATP-binding protein